MPHAQSGSPALGHGLYITGREVHGGADGWRWPEESFPRAQRTILSPCRSTGKEECWGSGSTGPLLCHFLVVAWRTEGDDE